MYKRSKSTKSKSKSNKKTEKGPMSYFEALSSVNNVKWSPA